MPRLSIGDCSLYVERHGAGFPVLMLSGLGGLCTFWRDQVAAFARDFEVVLHDHRGVGQSDHVKMKYTVEGMAADVLALMDKLGIEKAHFVGHSTGGAIAQILAIDHPERVATAVISSSWTKSDAYFRRLFTLRREILAGLGAGPYIQSATVFLYPSWWITKHNEALRGAEHQALATFSPAEITLSRIDAILAFDRTADLPKIKAPTLIVGSDDDAVTPGYHSEALARAIPTAELKMFHSGGHCIPQVLARDFNQAVLRFLHAHTAPEAAAEASSIRTKTPA
jgi:aminoacrylate hydrolase